MSNPLPPGQYELEEFPRFGLDKYANRFPDNPDEISLSISGDVGRSFTVSEDFGRLERIEQVSDFHCVTTWSKRSVKWGGVRFSDFYQSIAETAEIEPAATFVVIRSQDGFRASMYLDDLLKENVLLADTLDGQPLSIAHGAPLRLVAPAHYGYKSAKHLCGIEFWRDDRNYRPPAFRFMDHPRGRVEYEERGRWLPGVFFRWIYRPLVESTKRKFRVALDNLPVTRRD